jgi:hypothetical protein
VGGDFAEDVAGEDAHCLQLDENYFKCIAGCVRTILRGNSEMDSRVHL